MTKDNIQTIIDEIIFEPKKIDMSQDVVEFIELVNNRYVNGGVQIFKFSMSKPDLKKIRLISGAIYPPVWKIATTQNLIKQLNLLTSDGAIASEEPSDFTGVTFFEMLSTLSSMLYFGGAYSSALPGMENYKEKYNELDNIKFTYNFLKSFLPAGGEGFSNYFFYKTNQAWANWFFGVAWDFTAVIFDSSYTEISLICITDTD